MLEKDSTTICNTLTTFNLMTSIPGASYLKYMKNSQNESRRKMGKRYNRKRSNRKMCKRYKKIDDE